MKKLLYVDVPFQGLRGGDKNRSSFIWTNLSKAFQADLLLIKTPEYAYKAVPRHSSYGSLCSLSTASALPHLPEAIYQFNSAQRKKFSDFLRLGQYELIVFRFLSGYHLACLAASILPKCQIVIDVDMLFSRISELYWQQKPRLSNRYHLLEMLKLKAFEKQAFRQDFRFCFTNVIERNMAITRYGLKPQNALIFPNMMPELKQEISPNKDSITTASPQAKYILFFGTLNSVANQDAFLWLAQDIFPLLQKTLQEQNVAIYIVGKSPTPIYQKYCNEQLKLIGAVDDIEAIISGSLFVVLPLRIASGTRTRILEAAAVKKAIVSTSIGAEGFDFSADELILQDSSKAFAASMEKLLLNPHQAAEMGAKLYEAALAKYAPEVVARDFLLELQRQSPSPSATRKLKLAIVTNRFYPEVGGAETNIFYQARMLAEKHELTVICPKRIKKPRIEMEQGFRIIRLLDVFNNPPRYPNLAAKTLCPDLLLHLLRSDYDIIQCFPALNYNNALAFIAAKLRGIPFILCFFDFIDYAGEIAAKGKIDPDILKSVQPSFYQRYILKHMDYAFAIADKEISFLQRFNPRVEYSPVPILSEEYETTVANPLGSLGLNEDNFVFLCLGRVSFIKGQDIALKAFAKAHPLMPKAKLVYVGRTDYEPEFYAQMQSEIITHDLQDSVFFTGMVDREIVLAWLRYADIHVIPVRFMNSGAVVVESWISSTPVIQSRVVDPNLVIEDYNGYLFDTEDPDDCAQKMLKAFNNRAFLPALAENGKALVKTKYTYEYLIELYNKCYKLLGKA